MDFVYFFREKFLFVIGKNNIFLAKIIYRKKFIIGNNFKVRVSIRILIDGLGKIKIGNNFHAVSSRYRSYLTIFSPCHLTSIHGGEIIIGNHVGLNGNTIASKKKIVIGDDTMIGPNTVLSDHDGHDISPISRWENKGKSAEIIIGKNCWIGMNCIILKNVIIGDTTVIGAGSVVISNCDPNSVYAGNPAIKIKDI